MSRGMRKLLKGATALILGWTILYALLVAVKVYLTAVAPCARACHLPASTWSGDSAQEREPACQPLSVTVELAETRFSVKDIAPLWYRTTVHNVSCGVVEDAPLYNIRYDAHLIHPLHQFEMKKFIVDAQGRPVGPVMRSLHPEDSRGLLTLIFAPDDESLPRPPEKGRLLPGESISTVAERFQPRKFQHGPHGLMPLPLGRTFPRPREHPGFAAHGYYRFIKPGRYYFVVELETEVRVSRVFPRFEALPQSVKRAFYSLNLVAPLFPVPVPDFNERHGTYITIRSRSVPIPFEVAP